MSEERNSSATLAMRSSRQKPSLKTIKYGSMLRKSRPLARSTNPPVGQICRNVTGSKEREYNRVKQYRLKDDLDCCLFFLGKVSVACLVYNYHIDIISCPCVSSDSRGYCMHSNFVCIVYAHAFSIL